MMQVYAAEARKGLCVHAHLPVASLETGKHTWRPRTNGKVKVKGWAHFVLAKDKIAGRHRSRRTLGLRMGVVLYRSMFRAARDIYDTLICIVPNAQPRVYNLQPDARFFNAALEMLERQPGTMRRSDAACTLAAEGEESDDAVFEAGCCAAQVQPVFTAGRPWNGGRWI
ncbi:hypothetical protein L210DRAFT_3522177 [Boletus edulis BED1]|uniref:Uncharacterized protein n=1 Tax=Boletus edulis BED1 TaxID=1328754 RepID=A0AAD4GLI8_BOLED|nr:hypothetical protein L210DRAFT_3522177 [Boletus edulis BED1]